jgi:dephospho-CoA kinase
VSRRWPDKFIVGLTGNIATGKSTVMSLAEERDALALDADAFVHDLLATDPEAQRAIVDAFGASVAAPNGVIDRAALAAVVFNNPDALVQLEEIVHPRVRRTLFRRIDSSPHRLVFVEAIKLVEGGLSEECDQIWVTRCPMETQVERLMTYRELDRETALMRVRAQSSQELKIAAADVVIDTGGSLAMTRARFELAWAHLQRHLAEDDLLKAPSTQASWQRINRQDGRQERLNPQPSPSNEAPEVDPAQEAWPRNYDEFGPDIAVRRARPQDIQAMVELVAKATGGALKLDPGQLLSDLGERGYVIGEQAGAISAIGGWSAENLVATVDSLFVHPPEAFNVTGAAILREIEITANELICEVIIVVLGELAAAEMRQLLRDNGFSRVEPETLPRAWRAAIKGADRPETVVMLKVLRDTRQVRVRTLKE